MVPIDNLERLPRSLRLRKIAKILAEIERAAANSRDIAAPAYLREILALLARDRVFSPDKAALIQRTAAANMPGAAPAAASYPRRELSLVRQLLLSETGRQTADWDFYDDAGNLDPQKRRPFPGMAAYLEDIRSPYNVGAMFRSAESFGAERLWLSPLCADPLHPRAARTAMGCVAVLPWERLPLEKLARDYPLFALETGGIPLANFPFPRRGIMITGSEELGVSPEALALADASLGRVTIPMYGAKGSLNVSVAFGIVMQAWAAQIPWEVIYDGTET